jgi:RsiW-degrading membrane proteinase PrsW (M82 family)
MTKMVSFVQQIWFRVLFIGLVLFGITDAALRFTDNPNLVPTVILLGAFLVPVTFVIYLYQRFHHREFPVNLLAMTFLFGGVVGIVVAAVLEWGTLRTLSLVSLLGVGAVEESAKLLFPIFIFLRGKYRHEVDGILIGIACGMGFATLETMGYSLVSLISAHGSVGALDGTLLVRGLLSPAGHAAWTGYVCAVIWLERERARHPILNGAVLSAFVLVVLLHTSWDVFGSITTRISASLTVIEYIGLAAVALISLTLLTWRIGQAEKDKRINEEPLA